MVLAGYLRIAGRHLDRAPAGPLCRRHDRRQLLQPFYSIFPAHRRPRQPRIDGYPMAARGEAGRALGIAITASFIGGLVSFLCLCSIARAAARRASPWNSAREDMFSGGVLRPHHHLQLCAAKSLIKGLLSAINWAGHRHHRPGPGNGNRSASPSARSNLIAGVHFLTAMIGLFAIPQLVEQPY